LVVAGCALSRHAQSRGDAAARLRTLLLVGVLAALVLAAAAAYFQLTRSRHNNRSSGL
jgi:hypothetical protein